MQTAKHRSFATPAGRNPAGALTGPLSETAAGTRIAAAASAPLVPGSKSTASRTGQGRTPTSLLTPGRSAAACKPARTVPGDAGRKL